jgi:hypothetical protein
MNFYHLGKPKGILELETSNLKLEPLDRKLIPIMVIDDNEFAYLDHLRNHRFDITYFPDINSIESTLAYEIILCDIHGVGKVFKSKFEGAHVIAEIRKKYPFKVIIAYTGQTHDPSYNKYFQLADYTFKKDIDGDEWVEKLDVAIEKAVNPIYKWEKMRTFLLDKGVSMFEITKLENEYVKIVLSKKDITKFPSQKLVEEMNPDVRAVLQSFTASIIFKYIFG